MRQRAPLFAIAILAIVWGCAPATPYVPKEGGAYGWEERQLDDDTWLVRFHGNPKNSPHEIERNVLKRASQIALEHGFSHFMLTDSHTETRRVPGFSGQFAVPSLMPGKAVIVKCFHGSPDWVESVDAERFLLSDW